MFKTNVQKSFWENVGSALAEEHLNWIGLARIAGLAPSSIGSAKKLNSELRISTLLRICEALEKSPEELLYGKTRYRDVPQKKASSELLNFAFSQASDKAIMLLFPCLNKEEQTEILELAQRYVEEANL